MAKLTTLKPRLQTMETRRVQPLQSEHRRISGSARVTLKRRVYVRDGGRCCMCGHVVDLCDSELDHRLALQFGGDNETTNLWTLCIECHSGKSSREAAVGQPDAEALKHSVPSCEGQAGIIVI